MDKVEKKRQKEQYVVEEMIRLYCRKKHPKEKRQEGQMCPDCQKLSDYAKQRSQKCPFMEEKTFCANCKAVFRTKDAVVSSGACYLASGV